MTIESTSVRSDLQALAWENDLLREALSALELQLEDQGWTRLSGMMENEFSRDGLRAINAMARLMWLKNPLIQRGVNVQSYYVFGQGVEINANDADIDVVVQQFIGDSRNQAELFSHQALLMKERELTLFGNVFFVLFVDARGRVRIRTIPPDEIDDILCNPEDAKEPWWYVRTYQQRDMAGVARPRTVYYRDWRYMGDEAPPGATVEDARVFHVKTGGLSDMRFGVSEVYSSLDWAKAYKSFLEDWATIVRAYARFAWNLKVPNRTGVSAAKSKLGTTLGTGAGETNPPPVTGSTFIGYGDVQMQPMRTAGATTSAEDGRRLLLMVAASMGLPESFFGDVSVGTLATAKSLDRPTELKFVSRQSFWRDIIQSLCIYAVEQAIRARALPGRVVDEEDGTPRLEMPDVNGGPRDMTINVDFPPVLEHDVASSVEAIVRAATLGGNKLAPEMDARTVTRMLLTALGEQDVQAVMDVLYPDGYKSPSYEDKIATPAAFGDLPGEGPDQGDGEAISAPMDEEPVEAMMVNAVRDLRQAIAQFVERHEGAD